MRFFKGFLIIVLALAFMGCAHVREWSLDLAKSDTKNAKAVRDVSTELMNGWPTWSGMLAGILGARIKDFPLKSIEAWRELDMVTYCARKQAYPSNFYKEGEPNCPTLALNEYTLGYYSGARLRMLAETVIEAFKQYAPDLVGKLPTELLGLL